KEFFPAHLQREDMARIDEILSWQPPKEAYDTYGLESALCACLGPAEACELLVQCAIRQPDIRAGALRKVQADIENTPQNCHRKLVDSLLSLLESSGANGRQSIGYCLSVLAEILGKKDRARIEKA